MAVVGILNMKYNIYSEVAGEVRGQPVIVEITIMLDMFHSEDMIMKVID